MNPSKALRRAPRSRRMAAELALLVAMGLFAGAVGPFGTDRFRTVLRYAYWLACIVGGGAIGIAFDEIVGVRVWRIWPRLLVTSLAMTPPVTGLVLLIDAALVGRGAGPGGILTLFWQVWVISIAVMALRAATWRPAQVRIETRVLVAAPLPEAEALFRRRLSAKRRTARLIAVAAEDHYLRVHTDAGDELIGARFSEALAELAGAAGCQTHRSWWVATDAIVSVSWRRGAGEAKLAGGLRAPVSRTHAPLLRAAGWR